MNRNYSAPHSLAYAERVASMLELDAAAKGHQFSACSAVFMRLKVERTKERDEWKLKFETAEQALHEACCLLEECVPHITGCQENSYLNKRISLWIHSVYPHRRSKEK